MAGSKGLPYINKWAVSKRLLFGFSIVTRFPSLNNQLK